MGSTPEGKDVTRRDLFRHAAGAAAVTAMGLGAARAAEPEPPAPKLKGRINHSVCKWCYGKTPMDELIAFCVKTGIKSIELVGTGDWEKLKQNGLVCAMAGSHGIGKGLNRKENHAECLSAIRKGIEAAAQAGFPNVICFSGNRAGLADDVGIENCVEGLKQVAGFAEEKKVTICMELLNSKVNHKDYQCDHTAWGVEMCKRVGSERVKLLYDIYHVQIMEGDIIRTIRDNIQYIGHFHTGGVPGRNEIDDTQELYYPAILRAIVDTKFQGYVGQEFIPKRDPLTSLGEAIQICDV